MGLEEKMTSDVTPKDIFYLITLIVIISFGVYGLIVLPTPYERCLETAEQRRLECISSGADQIDCSRRSVIEKKSRCHKPTGHDWFRTDTT
jgi:hypothetical protein